MAGRAQETGERVRGYGFQVIVAWTAAMLVAVGLQVWLNRWRNRIFSIENLSRIVAEVKRAEWKRAHPYNRSTR